MHHFVFGVHSANQMGRPPWPNGTIAQGSDVHPPNIDTNIGKPRSYNESFAIDVDQDSFWDECVSVENRNFLRTTLTETL